PPGARPTTRGTPAARPRPAPPRSRRPAARARPGRRDHRHPPRTHHPRPRPRAGLPPPHHPAPHPHPPRRPPRPPTHHPPPPPGHARELFYTPGTTLHRILTDPADGRAIERTITTYRPDTDMRRQVHTADLYSRNPQHRLTGRTLEIDHVIPYGTPGGTTTET